jgi:predicted transcriptional regulator YdeE
MMLTHLQIFTKHLRGSEAHGHRLGKSNAGRRSGNTSNAIKDSLTVPGDYHVCELPDTLYAVFSTPPAEDSGFTTAIQGTWQYIFAEWFPKSGYEFDEHGVDFELYDERCMGKTGKVCDIYIPVVKK